MKQFLFVTNLLCCSTFIGLFVQCGPTNSKLSHFVHIFGRVTIRLAVGDFLWVVHCDHGSFLHRYGDIAPRKLDARTRTHACTDTHVILYSV